MDTWRRKRRANRWSVVHPATRRPIGYPGSIVNNPPPWRVLRTAIALSTNTTGYNLVFRTAATWLLTRPQYWFSNSAWFRFGVETGGVAIFVLTLAAFYREIDVRRDEEIGRAWSIIAAAKRTNVGNIGAAGAMETLLDRDIALTDVRLPGANLREVQLPKAKLGRANFGIECVNKIFFSGESWIADYESWTSTLQNESTTVGVKLTESECPSDPTDLVLSGFQGTNLVHSNFQGATVRKSDFSSACLYSSNFVGADLTEARFSNSVLKNGKLMLTLLDDTEFDGADLSYSDFSHAICRFQRKSKEVYGICPRNVFEDFIAEALYTCGITYPDGTKLQECTKKKIDLPECDERHGFPGVRRDNRLVSDNLDADTYP